MVHVNAAVWPVILVAVGVLFILWNAWRFSSLGLRFLVAGLIFPLSKTIAATGTYEPMAATALWVTAHLFALPLVTCIAFYIWCRMHTAHKAMLADTSFEDWNTAALYALALLCINSFKTEYALVRCVMYVGSYMVIFYAIRRHVRSYM